MKIRTGFVSNSSSSSFCLWGICVDRHDLTQELIKMGILVEDSGVDASEYIENNSVKVDYTWDDDNIYVGLHPAMMKDDQTLKEFKSEIKRNLEEVLHKKIPLKDIELHAGEVYN